MSATATIDKPRGNERQGDSMQGILLSQAVDGTIMKHRGSIIINTGNCFDIYEILLLH